MSANSEPNYDLIIMLIGSVISFVTGWGLSVMNNRSVRKESVIQSLKAIISEVEEIQKFFKDNTKPIIDIKKEDGELKSCNLNFTFGGITIAAYESMLFSGTLKEIDAETRRHIIDLYEHIKLYNSLKTRFQELITVSIQPINPIFLDNIQGFAKSITDLVEQIKTKTVEVLGILNMNKDIVRNG